MAAELIPHLKGLRHATWLGGNPWLVWLVFSVADFLTSPLTGIRTRSCWPELVASLMIAAALFCVRAQPGERTAKGLWHSTAPQHCNRNLGRNFAPWDWMCGTLYVPQGRAVLTFGLGAGRPQPFANGVTAYVLPFWQILPAVGQAHIGRLVRRPLAAAGTVEGGAAAALPRN